MTSPLDIIPPVPGELHPDDPAGRVGSPPRRVLVTGSRDWADRDTLRYALDGQIMLIGGLGVTVVHGACPTGADAMAHEWALNNWPVGVEPHPADWKANRRAGGVLRNQAMVDLGADLCLAFIRNNSAGAEDCARRAHEAGIPVRYYRA